jgi:O-antigen/teichoic acid export membrane protein
MMPRASAFSRGRMHLDRHSLSGLSFWMLVGKCLQMGCGFLFWVMAARAADVVDVGIAAASVAGIMLCTQIGVVGTGSAVIVSFARKDQSREHVLDIAFTLVLVASLTTGAGYVLVTSMLGGDSISTSNPVGFVFLFLTCVVTGTACICLDQISIALAWAGSSSMRYATGGVVALVGVVAWSGLAGRLDATDLLGCWALGSVCSCLVGAVQLGRRMGYRYHPTLRTGSVAKFLGVGLPNQVLTLTERVPPLLVPVIIAHQASPTMTAYWYPAWMLAWIAYSAPIMVGLVQFSEGVRHPDRLRASVLASVKWSLVLGGSIAVVLGTAAPQILQLMGEEYASASVDAVRILSIGLIPFAVVQAYNAACRALGKTTEGIALGVFVGICVCGATASLAHAGTTDVAVSWVAVSGLGAAVALWRLRILLHLVDAPPPRGLGAR